MAEYDSELVATIADAIRPYVRRGHAEEVAVEVLTDLVADGWQIRHPNDEDIDEHEVASIHLVSEDAQIDHRRVRRITARSRRSGPPAGARDRGSP